MTVSRHSRRGHRRAAADEGAARDRLFRLVPSTTASGSRRFPRTDTEAPGWVPDNPSRAPFRSSPALPAPPVPGGVTPGHSGGDVPREPRPSRASAAVADRLPLALRAVLVRPTRHALVGLVVVAAAGAVLAVLFLWWARPSSRSVAVRQPLVARDAPVTGAARPAPSQGAASSPAVVVVHVAGAVRRPGLVTLPAGSRVADAVRRVGGPTSAAATASVNLARMLVDGEQLVVLRRGEALPPQLASGGTATGSGASGSAAGAPVDLNLASLGQLDALPGVGPVLAQRIIDWRLRNGRFSSIDELREVSGIGDAKFADLRALVRV